MPIPDALETYLREVAVVPLLSAEQEVELGRRVRKGDEEARAQMVRANLRLVIRIARYYTRDQIRLEDLVAEGNIGLIRAVDRFDPERGFRFSTYAAWWIRQAIGRARYRMRHLVHLPTHQITSMREVARARDRLEAELGRLPTPKEIGGELGRSKKAIATTLQAGIVSRAGALGSDAFESDFGLVDSDCIDPGERAATRDLGREVLRRLDTLAPRERKIVSLRFGLGGENPLTLREIGVRLGLTRERIRQLLDKSLRQVGDDATLEAPRRRRSASV